MAPVEDDTTPLGSVELAQEPSGARVVRLIGEIDISNAHSLGAQLDAFVGDGGGRIVVDLAALEFMDSSGIAMLLRAAGSVDSIEIRNATTVVRRIIECAGLADVLRIEP
ncbi:MAG TPA: STAS domain-containing protein [Acidimicrobiia bacterium]|jgi:anti-anti-sigma factor|nr:STAS domain-containing protein [Acidimicrobiia bacterium]